MIWLVLISAAWILGWLRWFIRQDRDWTSEVMFNMTFGFALWPFIWLCQLISGEWSRLGRW